MSENKYSIENEKKWQKFWEENQIFKFDKNTKKEIYSIDTPPPTISGKIHIGHIFSYTQAEVIARYKKMCCYEIFYPFGFDDNGLPTERLVEKEIGKIGSQMPRKEFINECLNTTSFYRGKFKDLWSSMGFSVDWDLAYSTISKKAQATAQTSFINLYKKGIIYQKKSPSLWCPECQTAIAQAEVEKKEFESIFYDIEFDLENDEKLIISTTRPELLPGCVGIFVNPKDERYKIIIGKYALTPFGDKIKILSDDKVEINLGTGAVMCCSYGDETDMYWIKKYSLEEKIILDKLGKITNTNFQDLNGIYYKKVRKLIVEKLENYGKIKNKKNITHDVGTHERCSTPIEILNVKQWFVKVLDIKDELLKAGEEINWYPSYMKKRYDEWVTNLKWDWCISRQRYFGIPIPVWYEKKTGNIILLEINNSPINPLNDLPAGYKKEDLIPEEDVLDTWATSSLTPLINSSFFEKVNLNDKILPFSLRPQAHDIIRTWALYTIIMSHYHEQKIPFKNIMISGHVLAPKGEKISKSKNNAGTTPEELIKKFGADPVRYWACSGNLGKDITFDENEIEKGRKLVTKLFNAANLVKLNLESFDKNNIADLEEIDKWIIYKSEKLGTEMKKSFESFNVGIALIEFEKFFWSDFCDNYLEIIKGKKIFETNEKIINSLKYGLYKSFLNIIKSISPILPHISEYIYQDIYKKYEKYFSICESDYPELNGDSKESEEIKYLFEIIDLIRKLKAENNIKYSQISGELIINSNKNDILKKFISEIKAISKCEKISFCDGDFSVEIIK